MPVVAESPIEIVTFDRVPDFARSYVRDYRVRWALEEAALNSVEPMLLELTNVDLFARDEEWAKLRRPSLVATIDKRLGQLATALGDRDYLEGRFTAGDLLMASALRALDHTDLLEAHPAFVVAIEAQLGELRTDMPEPA